MYSEAAEDIESRLNAEFASEGFVAVHDDIHDSLGHEGAVIGIAPAREYPEAGAILISNFEIEIKFFTKWDAQIDPTQSVDPRPITRYGERFKQALRPLGTPTSTLWFYDILGLEYVNDPTGNKTRFVATVRARGNNIGVIETTG